MTDAAPTFYEVLCTRPGAPSAALRAWMWCPWSHAALYDAGKGVATHSTFWGRGVHETHAEDFFAAYEEHTCRAIPVAPEAVDAARAWLAAQVGKRYDWTALFGIALHRDWSEEDAWFCSELTESFRNLFAARRFSERMSRVTPAHQWMLAA